MFMTMKEVKQECTFLFWASGEQTNYQTISLQFELGASIEVWSSDADYHYDILLNGNPSSIENGVAQ